jgi:hypothetical protein
MPDRPKRALAETIDERRPPRRDPRAEPESVRPESVTQAAAAKLEGPIVEEYLGSRRPPDSKSLLDSAGASGVALLRRQLSTLQMQLSEAQGQLAREQGSRAEDAEEMARVLERLSAADAENESLRDDLERERKFVEELRVSVREKYEDCNTLRQKLADAESLIAKELEEAAERHALTERAERAEQEIVEVTKQLEVSRASEESVRGELATHSAQLEILRRAYEKQEAELTKSSASLKNANMKAFAANKQLESWKAESQRTMEQTRVEQEVVLTKLAADHAKAIEAARTDADEARTRALEAQKQLGDATEKLAMATWSLETLDETERQVRELRDKAEGLRRAAREQAAEALQAVAPKPSAVSPAPSLAPSMSSKAAPPLPSKAPRTILSKPAPQRAASVPAPPAPQPLSSEVEPPKENLRQTLREEADESAAAAPQDAAPPAVPFVAPVAASGRAGGEDTPPDAARLSPEAKVAPKVEDPPYLEFGEIEMAAEELVEDLIEARNRARR